MSRNPLDRDTWMRKSRMSSQVLGHRDVVPRRAIDLMWGRFVFVPVLFLVLILGTYALSGFFVQLAFPTTYAPGFDEEAFRTVEVGASTEAVLKALGKPLETFSRQSGTIKYTYANTRAVYVEGAAIVAWRNLQTSHAQSKTPSHILAGTIYWEDAKGEWGEPTAQVTIEKTETWCYSRPARGWSDGYYLDKSIVFDMATGTVEYARSRVVLD